MRKWIAGLLALTALSPVAASAQDAQERPERGGWQRGPRAELRADVSADAREAPGDDARPDRGPREDRPDRGPREQRADRPAFQPDRGVRGDDRPPAPRADRAQDRAASGRPDRQRDDAPAADRPARDGWQRQLDRMAAGAPQPRGDRPQPGGFRRDDRPAPDGFAQRDRRDDRGRPDRSRPDRDRAGRDRPGRDHDDWTRSRFDDRDDGWTQSRFGGGAGWNRGWRGDRRYDWNRYRATNRDAFRLPRYYAPYGWSGGYRRFQIGVGLSAALWNRSYWIADPYAYRLPEAYGPYRWVRYYDDALLVDLRTGVVVDAAYGIFW